jgi:NAD(P)-dependent dehydrogenase (short-subunit alcohol dehydrogenase family)
MSSELASHWRTIQLQLYPGLAFTKALLVRPECIVFAGARNPAGADELLKLSQQYPERLHIVQAVSADEEGNSAMRQSIQKLVGRLDIVIANAGKLDMLSITSNGLLIL